jgi:hypothetical protein
MSSVSHLISGAFAFMDAPFAVHPNDSQAGGGVFNGSARGTRPLAPGRTRYSGLSRVEGM